MSVGMEKTCSIPSPVLGGGYLHSPVSVQMPGIVTQAKSNSCFSLHYFDY